MLKRSNLIEKGNFKEINKKKGKKFEFNNHRYGLK